YAARFGFDELKPFHGGRQGKAGVRSLDWESRLRMLLDGRPDAKVRIGDLLPDLEDWPCVLPWTRLELHEGGSFGPCCSDYMAVRSGPFDPADPAASWHSDLMRDFRKAMVSGDASPTCRSTCPVLAGGGFKAADIIFRGGPKEAVENAVRLSRGLLEGRVDADWAPLDLAFSVTSFCNYDCLMCDCGQRGTLDDELTQGFYAGLEKWLNLGVEFEVNGGEPLASPVFRAFVRDLALSGRPPSLNLVTNGSYLTPKFLSGLPVIPFRGLVVSLNAADAGTYRDVNRGLSWSRIRRNLDALLDARLAGRFVGGLSWSMVIIRRNLDEIRAFARMAMSDEVDVRYLLPIGNRNEQSIMGVRDTMREAADALFDVALELESGGWARGAGQARSLARFLEDRLAGEALEVHGRTGR
ncbi:MAG: radical SAM protein, partial [Deltaproteobacteria bacterium]|nr:radical SAM protein [Deltaproteobacteria bacterium]